LAQKENNIQIAVWQLNNIVVTYNLEIHPGKAKVIAFK
jgi:hypothetical protein